MTESTAKPFVDYYRNNAISPVAQDIENLERHFERRESLYRACGLVPHLLGGRSIIEFGPGSGHNALYTNALGPRRYVLVDGNSVGLSETSALLHAHGSNVAAVELVESMIEDFRSGERFDLALCEGTIPTQRDPIGFARGIGRFVTPGGVLLITTQDATTSLADLLRRIVGAYIVPRDRPVRDALERLRPYFAAHTATLAGMTRSTDDWVLDNVIQPFYGEMFSIVEAIDGLGPDGFEILGTSPRFFAVWRWHKTLTGADRDIAPIVRDAYYCNAVNLMDYRLGGGSPNEIGRGRELAGACDEFYQRMKRAESSGSYDDVLAQLAAIADLIEPVSNLTARSITEAIGVCRAAAAGASFPETPNFASFFGHGQQYVSFIRRGPEAIFHDRA